jgi:hypothetical protein
MEILQIINEIASLLVFVNATLFYIFIFGREIAIIERLPTWEKWLLRVGLALPAVGSFYNVLYVSYPPFSEIIINVGYASLFTWASIFHYNHFVRNDRKK